MTGGTLSSNALVERAALTAVFIVVLSAYRALLFFTAFWAT